MASSLLNIIIQNYPEVLGTTKTRETTTDSITSLYYHSTLKRPVNFSIIKGFFQHGEVTVGGNHPSSDLSHLNFVTISDYIQNEVLLKS